jgi:hypothetical protein
MKRCEGCGEPFVPNSRGRPRRFCADCSVPAVAARRWRERRPERVEAYNAARRVAPPEPRECSECGKLFVPGRRDGEMCSDLCRARHSHRRTRDWLRQYGFGSGRAPTGRQGA